METQIWSKSEEKWAYILVLRGHDVHWLKLTGNMFTLKNKVQGALDALQQGQDPTSVKASSVKSLDARTVSKAAVAPEKNHLTLYGGNDGSEKLDYQTGDSNADVILEAILAQSGKTFQPAQEEIGVVEALIPPAFFGGVLGVFWAMVYMAAGKMASGEEVEVKGIRRRGLQRILITIAEVLGTNGTIAVGVVLLLLMIGWAVKRIIHRPQRTVWLPATQAATAA